MSTPSGKPLNSIDASTAVSHEMHERADVKQRRIDDEMIRDLERLLASVRWVQREEVATRRRGVGSLDPERPVPPALSSRFDNLRGLLLILIVSIFAVLSALYFWVEGGGPSSKHSTGEQMVTAESNSITPPPSSPGEEDSRTNITQDYALGTLPTEARELSQTAAPTTAMLPQGTPSTQAPLSSTRVRAVDPEAIKLLMKQGEEFMAAGDVVTARTVFQR